MEQIIKCRSLTAIFQGDKLLLGGPHIVEFDTTDEQKFHIKLDMNFDYLFRSSYMPV